MSRPVLLLGLAALALTSAAPPPATQPVATTTELESPVLCRAYQHDLEETANITVSGSYQSRSGRNNARVRAAPTPPPPPPPAHVASPPIPPIVASTAYAPAPAENRERYDGRAVSNVLAVAEAPVSTFSVDVDTGAYANVRRMLRDGEMPPSAAVRTEELLNYFRYDYPRPSDRSRPFSVSTDVATTPWNPNTRLLRIGLRGYDLPAAERPAANLVFLVDVSGSMASPDKLPLVRDSLKLLTERLSPRDRVSIVVYAGAAGLVLKPTARPDYIKQALDCLEAGGSTAGGEGIQLAYEIARAHRIEGGINRVILATDGDFNVGVTDDKALEDLVARNREDGITLTTLGFGTGNYNEAMMERIADVGNGNYAYVDTIQEARKVLDEEMASTLFTIAKDVKIQVEFNPAFVGEYRLIGYENRALREEDFDNDRVDAGEIGASHQVTALYEIVPAGAKGWLPERRYRQNQRLAGADGPEGELCFVKLRYKLPDGERSMLIEHSVPSLLLQRSAAPAGDMAFQTAVAAFGQRLRGDTHMNGFDFADIARLAGRPDDVYRREFVELVGLAAARTPGSRQGGGR